MRRRLKYVCLVITWSLWAVAAYANDMTILVVESYHREYEWDMAWKEGIHEVLVNGYRLEYVEMDTKRISESHFQEQADNAWKRYEALQPELVILGDDDALKYLAPRLAETDTPVVYLGINANPRSYIPSGAKNFTGVLERPLLWRSIRMIDKIVPIKKVLVLFDSGTTAKAVVDTIFQGDSRIHIRDVTVDIRSIATWEAWQTAVQEATEPYDVIIVGLYHTLFDAQGTHISEEEAITWTARYALLPLFGFWDFAVGKEKTIGGLVLCGIDQGRIAAELANKILQGTPPNTLFPETSKQGRLIFSQSQLEKYHFTLLEELTREAEFVE